ncbi:MAG: hypothetical protein ABSH56_06080 [Bryobacteraceae bacterium]
MPVPFRRLSVAGRIMMLLVPSLGVAQAPQQSGTLAIAGHTGTAPVVKISGKSYVEVEALARLTNGSIAFRGDRITLTLSAAPPATAPPAPAPNQPPEKKGYSRDFLRATIDAMTAIGDWRSAIVNAIQHSYPVTEDYAGSYRRTAESKVDLVSAAAPTDADRECLALVRNELAAMQKLSDEYVAMQKNQTYVAPDSMASDPLDQQVLNCARGLSSLPAGGEFQDVAACH